ncbi:molybdenum cofactor guanylyltransferase [Aliiglaciecola sp. CAU 1673]|uniref:molybdenum cofactor guanylyltransferase n=1 Tax=Aliiglaciecola sp. CAU 1673 TaxID=3032595 RepID=UPI0023DCA2D5|nr:molybdenum cofactor guanylyltransferase [Aliiglaciecola sp. CAU 1673]MDF2177398.1 molybdenum cofactor guanylyltransferase [Aliiglaciecola sp. CAU 1673]
MLVGLVLAGGKSSRMGQDKAALTQQGQSLLQRAQALLTASSCEQVLTSRNTPGFLQDRYPGAGPLAGIDAALNSLTSSDALLVIPVDMPALTPILLSQLVNAGQEHNLPCYFKDSCLPLYLPVSQKARDYLQTELSSGGKARVQTLLEALNARPLPCAKGESLSNINTLNEWQGWLQQTASGSETSL